MSHEIIFNRHNKYILNNEIRNIADMIINTMPNNIGLPLGVEPSQAEMIAFPSALDNYIKCQLRLKYAGHYMDDYYILIPPDINSRKILNSIIEKTEELKIKVNKSKTRIIPISKGFRYCKIKYMIDTTGKLIL